MANEVYWHDGTIESIEVIAPGRRQLGSIEVRLSLYPTETSRTRAPFKVSCRQVSKFEIVADALELKDNAGAGNIEDGEIRKHGDEKELVLRLVRGHVRVRGQNVSLRKVLASS